MKKSLFVILFTAVFVILSSVSLFAQNRIEIQPGANAEIVSGSIYYQNGLGALPYRTYVIHLKEGQTFRASVSSRNGNVFFSENKQRNWTFRATAEGDFNIVVFNRGEENTRFSMTVSVR